MSSRWTDRDGVFTLKVTVPVNTVAEVHVPADTPGTVTECGRPADRATGVRFLRMEDGAAVFQVGSGTYDSPQGRVPARAVPGARGLLQVSPPFCHGPGTPRAYFWPRNRGGRKMCPRVRGRPMPNGGPGGRDEHVGGARVHRVARARGRGQWTGRPGRPRGDRRSGRGEVPQ
ncbi:alpha-L-rhamnosidase C-terminal domain-containing protein [Streptomyces massasporeus]|uniref:alpha-L-rhamnosidase C-terminal domain-containing protein n=1 Tax=Streptomyces massasporeus TaxID=67324 RepID=UPI0033DE5570